jgi:hypothetical protein
VAFGCVTGLALALGLPLTCSYGGARMFGYLAGAAGRSVVLITSPLTWFAVAVIGLNAIGQMFFTPAYPLKMTAITGRRRPTTAALA